MAQARHQERWRQQEQLGARRWVVALCLLFLELEPGHFAKQPASQRPGAVILAGNRQRSHDFSPAATALCRRAKKLSRTAA